MQIALLGIFQKAILALMPKDIYKNVFHNIVDNNGKLEAT